MWKHLLQLADEYWTVFHESSLCLFGLCSPTNPGWQNRMAHISEIYSNCDLCPPGITENNAHQEQTQHRGTLRPLCWVKYVRQRKTSAACSHLEFLNLTHKQSRNMVVTRGLGMREMGRYWLKGKNFQS